jgi:hypothetical protein
MLRGVGSRSGRFEVERTCRLEGHPVSEDGMVASAVPVEGASCARKASMTPPPLAVSRGSGVVISANFERSTVMPTRAWVLLTSLYSSSMSLGLAGFSTRHV